MPSKEEVEVSKRKMDAAIKMMEEALKRSEELDAQREADPWGSELGVTGPDWNEPGSDGE